MNSAADMNFSKASRALPEDLLEMKEKIRKYLDL
jgi:hypothetical protein